MPPARPILIEISRVDRDKLPGVLDGLRGCWKSSSILWMQANGFRVLQGVILSSWTGAAESIVLEFSQAKNLTELLVRIEKCGERWTNRRGGYTIPVAAAHGLVDELAEEGMLTLLLEPRSPYCDLYSLTAVIELVSGRTDVEVVGPGFDASDILRSDTTPHERFEVSLNSRGLNGVSTRRTHLVEPKPYRMSVRKRLMKIGAKLRNPSFPEEVLRAESDGATDLAEEAVRHLKKTTQTLLVDHMDEYKPIPSALLDKFIGHLARIFRAASEAGIPWSTLSAAGSFLGPENLVLWDFYAPGSYDTTQLARMKTAS